MLGTCLEDEGAPLAMAEIRDEPAEWMLDTIASGMTVIDIGAHQGRYAIRFSQKVGATGLVVAVEPNERNQAVLAQNLELNGIRNVKSVQAACWSRREALEFLPGITLDLSRVGESRGRKHDTVGLPLDELAESLSLQRVDVLKIDVEGAELEVLEGGKPILEKFRPRIFLEFHATLAGSIDWFRDHGYRVVRKQNDSWTERNGWVWAVPKGDAEAASFGGLND